MYSYDFSFVGFKLSVGFQIVLYDEKFIPSPFDELCVLNDQSGELVCTVRGQVDEPIFCESKGIEEGGETITCWESWRDDPIMQTFKPVKRVTLTGDYHVFKCIQSEINVSHPDCNLCFSAT